ncbi:hypothetical protein CE657_005064 [Salmonella enterica subsp. diarizonae serovar 38:[k]:z35]|nr:hypothetical protein [Salmonella enterica subsp. diarizonae]EEJ8835225.1 hypothetical protein [Salmonella enterica subsp. diarizonae]EGE4753942.1 hypothetical protein [Salmonella enterica subsp. diarizonae serovar 38:[k]:z35]HAF0278311.1 hypothetical protein [Salmonella enterica subsp. diarizonae serovar 38:[k]:z35:-]
MRVHYCWVRSRQLATASWTDYTRSEQAARRASEASQSPPHRHITSTCY